MPSAGEGSAWGLEYRIRTPENVTFEFEVAGLASRFAAWLMDLLFLAGGCVGIALALSILTPLLGALSMALTGVSVFAFIWGYHVFFEYARGGATPGKRLLGLQVISGDGLPIDFWQAMVRNLLRVVDFLSPVYLVGASSAWLDRWNRRLGDIAAGTMVVRKRRAARPEEVIAPSERYNTLQEDLALAARLRREIDGEARETLVSMCLRRNELELGARLELFGLAAAALRRKFALPADPNLSDERLVINVAAVLLGGGAAKPAALLARGRRI